MTTDEALHRLNHKVAKEVEIVASELNSPGSAHGYAAGLRCVVFASLNALVDLDAPELRGDLERIRAYCDELLEEPDPPAE